MSDLVTFLRARLDEDEHAATEERDADSWNEYDDDTYNSPARVLREVEAKRRIVSLYRLSFRKDGQPSPEGGYAEAYWDVLRLLAEPYSDHPDFDPSWRS